MNRGSRVALIATVTLALAGTSRPVWAQDGTARDAPPPPPPAAPIVVAAPAEPAGTDHDAVVGRFGLTYFDITNLPIANPVLGGGAPGAATSSNVQAPVVGGRYWLNRTWGIDAGIGLGLAGGSTETVVGGVDTTVNKTSTTGFALHAGVPIALAHGRHYTFLIIPNTTIGFTTASYTPPAAGAASQDLSGFLFDIGARAGAEIHFGFMGIPQLALQATIGLSFRRSVFKWSAGGNSASDGTNTFGTNVQADPWSIFKDAISATYYF
jgi:hypothetical protein